MNKDKLKKKSISAVISVFRFVLVFGLCFIILYPFLIKILAACMSPEDLLDSTVKLIPRTFSNYYWKYAWDRLDWLVSGVLSLRLSLISSILQVIVSTMAGYGLARFKFKGRTIAFITVMAMLLVPAQVYSISQYLGFRYFGVGGVTINLLNTEIPFYMLAFGGLSVKQGLYVYLMREFFKGLPRDLESAAYVDGASIGRTFISIVLPNCRNMMITIFLFAFCWQWMDTDLSSLYFTSKSTLTMRVIGSFIQIKTKASVDPFGTGIAKAAAVMFIILPVVLLAIVCQKSLAKSISQSGLAN